MGSDVKVVVCCHKDDVKATTPPFMPIHVGKALSSLDLGIQGDDTGDNISEKNASYCEMTGMYWAWKNLKDVEVIGLCHYRRYFDFHNQCRPFMPNTEFEPERFPSLDISIPDKIIESVRRGKVVVAKPNHYMYSLATDYCRCHISDDFKTLQHHVKATQIEKFVKAFNVVMCQRNALTPYNMFLMTWEDFDRYCAWIFGILKEMEDKIDISHYNPVQGRIWGFMAERLFNVWLYAEKRGKTIYKPVIKICDEPRHDNWFRFQARRLRYDLIMQLSKPIFD